MKVKIGDKIYDSVDQPIMLILSKKDKENISNMAPEATKYASFSKEFKGDIYEFMEVEKEKSAEADKCT